MVKRWPPPCVNDSAMCNPCGSGLNSRLTHYQRSTRGLNIMSYAKRSIKFPAIAWSEPIGQSLEKVSAVSAILEAIHHI